MRWTNYHGHSKYCDGHGEIEEYVLKAIELNMACIGISSHAPVPFHSVWNMPADKLQQYCREIDYLKVKYKDKINVYKSLEVDYIPGLLSPTHIGINKLDLDYTIGSVHYVSCFDDGTHWEIDGPAPEFKVGFDKIFHSDFKKLAMEFYALQNEMLQNHTPDILGHMDKIKMHNSEFNLFDENEQWYLDQVYQTLKLAKEKNVVVEINTKAFKRSNHLFPGKEHFQFIKENNIPVTINSDAHLTKFLTLGFEDVAKMLLSNGINTVYELINGEWQPTELVREGILI
nr:histidinol-phosphatase [uncultured Carboxylicivirga sp.]